MERDNQEVNLNSRPKPTVLIILDGWGVARDSIGNAITRAKTPNFEKYCREYFCTVLQASGEAVGLPWQEMGNSEVGHLNIGAGRIIYQNLPRINKAITDGSFFTNPVFLKAFEHAKKFNSQVHLMGLLSDGGVHSYEDHLYNLLELAQQQKAKQVFIHPILDGRDVPFNSGLIYLQKLQSQIDKIGVGKIATLSGRYWAMDRDNHWERTQEVFKVLTGDKSSNRVDDVFAAVEESYKNNIFDEEFKPVVVNPAQTGFEKVSDNDVIIFFNFRADRARQLTKAFVLPSFDKFGPRVDMKNLFFVGMTQYEQYLPVEVAFPPENIEDPLAKVVSEAGLTQLHIAETEKYAHVTYFFNGGQEKPFEGEIHDLVASPRVSSYDQKPEMSAREVKDRIVKSVEQNKYDFICVNFANPDMVAHTGNLKATIKAIEVVDNCLGEVVDSVMTHDGAVVVIADHGNAECLIKPRSGETDKEHSTVPVPCLVIGRAYRKQAEIGKKDKIDLSLLTPTGILADIAPTILSILNIPKPKSMIGRSLVG